MGHRSKAVEELTSRFSRLEHTGRLAEPFTKITSAIRALEDLHAARDLTMPEAYHIAKVGKAAQSLASKLESLKASALSLYTTESGRVAGQIVDRLNLKESKYGEELRRLIVAMPLSDRVQYVTDLAKDPEAGPMLSALSSAPSVLHGVPRDVLQATEKQFVGTHAPDLITLQDDLDSALDLISAAHRTASVQASEYQNPADLKRISEAEQAATQAQQRMSEALL